MKRTAVPAICESPKDFLAISNLNSCLRILEHTKVVFREISFHWVCKTNRTHMKSIASKLEKQQHEKIGPKQYLMYSYVLSYVLLIVSYSFD